MKQRVLISLGVVAALAACSGRTVDLRLYPTSGPIAAANAAQIIAINVGHQTETSAEVSFRLPEPDKTKCTGTWTSVAPQIVSHEQGLSLSIRGPGGRLTNSTQSLGGVNSGELYAVCKDGRVVQGHFITGSGTESGTGTVTDTKGNTYKLLF